MRNGSFRGVPFDIGATYLVRQRVDDVRMALDWTVTHKRQPKTNVFIIVVSIIM